jgi:probable F420-dependent oxidoreductase
MDLGKLGAWMMVDGYAAPDAAAMAKRVESWGYGALWIPEGVGRDAFVSCGWLLANTTRLNLCTGIANLYARHALTSVSAQQALAEQSGGRFLLGLGVSHDHVVEGLRGQVYEKPIPTMRAYLEAMATAKYAGPAPDERPKTVIAALGPKMLQLARDLADGAHPYNVTPEHTARAREILGPGKLLCPEQMVVLETDPATARGIARRSLGRYLAAVNYRNNFLRMGFSEADMEAGGSDRLIDAIVAWGNADAILARVQAHWDAGADHVCIQSLPRDGRRLGEADLKVFELLAPE